MNRATKGVLVGTVCVVIAGLYSISKLSGRQQRVDTTDTASAGREPRAAGDRVARQSRSRLPATDTCVESEPAGRSTVPRSSEPQSAPETISERSSGRDALLELLASRVEPPTPHMDIVADTSSFARCFAATGSGTPETEPSTDRPPTARELGTHEFPAGCHSWDPETIGHDDQHVLLVGAGMDETLVVLEREIALIGRRTLTLKNLTIHCDDHCLASINGAALVHLDHCRIIGFDAGGRSGDMLRGAAVALWAEHSRVEGGFGSAPGRGYLFNTSPGPVSRRRMTLARFEDCVVRGPLRAERDATVDVTAWLWAQRGPTCLFVRCELLDMAAVLRDGFQRPPEMLRLDDCRLSYVAGADEGPAASRDVSQLNSAWRMPGSRR